MPLNFRLSLLRSRCAEGMVRPRFSTLPQPQQQVILSAARNEFAARGFHDASLNKVIETAGISKGSMYYYFDGKEDLYAHVVRTELDHFFPKVGAVPSLEGGDANAYWAELEEYFLRLMKTLVSSTQLAELLRGWSAVSRSPAFQNVQRELEQTSMQWVEHALSVGQRVGAVRNDVPSSLLIAVVLGMGEAMDAWLLTEQPSEESLPGLISTLTSMIRSAVGA